MDQLRELNMAKGRILRAIAHLENPRDKSRNKFDRALTNALTVLREHHVQGVPPRRRLRNSARRQDLIWNYLLPLWLQLNDRSDALVLQAKQLRSRTDRQRMHQKRRYNSLLEELNNKPVGLKITVEYMKLTEEERETGLIFVEDARVKRKTFLCKSKSRKATKDADALVKKFADLIGVPNRYHIIVKTSIETTSTLPEYTLLNHPMKDRHSPKLMTFDNTGREITKYINNNNDQCVIDYIFEDYVKTYGYHKERNPKGKMKWLEREDIAREIEQLWRENKDSMVTTTTCGCGLPFGCEKCNVPYDAMRDGVSVQQLELFCKKYQITLRVCDIDNKQLHSWITPKDRRLQPMMIIVHNGHLYPIVNEKLRISLRNSGRYFRNKRDNEGKVVVQKNDKHEPPKNYVKISETDDLLKLSQENNETCFILEEDILEQKFLDLLTDRNEYYQHKYKANHMAEIYLPNKNMVAYNSDYSKVIDVCKILDVPFTNQSLMAMTNDLLKSKAGDLTRFNSTMTTSVLDAIKNDLPCNNWVKSYNEHTNIDDVVGLDFNKMYSSILGDPDMNWFSLDINSKIELYTGGKILSEKLYYIETDSDMLFQGNGWYFSNVVKAGLKGKLITKERGYLNFTVRNKDVANECSLTHGGACVIQSLRIESGSTELERIDDYNVLHPLITAFVANAQISTCLDGTDFPTSATAVSGLELSKLGDTATGKYDHANVSISLHSGVLNNMMNKATPLMGTGGLTLVLSLGTPTTCLVAEANKTISSYTVENPRYVAPVFTVADSNFQDRYVSMVQDTGVEYSGVTYKRYTGTLTAGAGSDTIQINDRSLSLRGLLAGIRSTADITDADKNSLGTRLIGIDRYTYTLAGQNYPSSGIDYSVRAPSQAFAEALKYFGVFPPNGKYGGDIDLSSFTTATTNDQQAHGCLAIDLKKWGDQSTSFNGINTASSTMPSTALISKTSSAVASTVTVFAQVDAMYRLGPDGSWSVAM